MGWIYLLLGGVFEIGWPLGMKLAQATGHRFLFLSVSVISMALSGYFLYMGQKTIPSGRLMSYGRELEPLAHC